MQGLLTIYAWLFTTLALLSGPSQADALTSGQVIRIDHSRSVTLAYRPNASLRLSLQQDGHERDHLYLPIPAGRDPSPVGAQAYNRFLFPHPIRQNGDFLLPLLFALRSQSSNISGQCAAGVEIELKIIRLRGNKLKLMNQELVQSCKQDIYLTDNGNDDFSQAFQITPQGLIVSWMSHPDNAGDEYRKTLTLGEVPSHAQ